MLVAVLACIQSSAVYTYTLNSSRWAAPQTAFYVDISGAGGSWNTAFADAMAQWTSDTVFTYSLVTGQSRDPCHDPNVGGAYNGVNFASTVCGDAWGSGVLAITTTWSVNSRLTQAGIVFNSNKSWDIYTGPLQYPVPEFRRVAVHELGHALGLGHEDDVPAIMGTYISDIENPTADDIAGVLALYGPAPDTTPNAFSFLDKTNVATSTVITSATVTITGINAAAPISVTGGTYSIGCTATFKTAAGTISNNQTVCVRHTSAVTVSTATNTSLTVGGVADTFTSTTAAVDPDTDGDGVPDTSDNCKLVANNEPGTVPNSPGVLKAQLDADRDGYGNACDGDLNNTGLTSAQDNTLLRNVLNLPYNANAIAANADMNGSGLVTAADSTLLRNRLNTLPGPSGLACAGTVPCP